MLQRFPMAGDPVMSLPCLSLALSACLFSHSGSLKRSLLQGLSFLSFCLNLEHFVQVLQLDSSTSVSSPHRLHTSSLTLNSCILSFGTTVLLFLPSRGPRRICNGCWPRHSSLLLHLDRHCYSDFFVYQIHQTLQILHRLRQPHLHHGPWTDDSLSITKC